MSDVIRRTLGFLMLNWPLIPVTWLIVRWIMKGEPRS